MKEFDKKEMPFEGHIYIQPRQSGKTTMLINDIIDDENSCLIVRDNQTKIYIKDQVRRSVNFDKKIYTDIMTRVIQINIIDPLTVKIRSYDTIYIDDYFFFSQEYKKRVSMLLEVTRPKRVIVRSTSDRKYPQQLVKWMRGIRYIGLPIYTLDKKWTEQEDVTELWNNILTDPCFEIHTWHADHKKHLNKEDFEVQIMGEVFI